MKVMKFWRTSVGSVLMKNVATLITADNEPKIVVLSAVSGTTNKLVAIADAIFKQDSELAIRQIDLLKKEYQTLIQELYKTENALEKSKQLLQENFNYLVSFTRDLFTVYEERAC